MSNSEIRIISQQNDNIDAICHRHYGTSSMVEAVLERNRGLADYGPVLPIGVEIILPAKTKGQEQAEKQTIKLWN
ncbi:tail protein X [uncultured Kiloniella sp.]|uniref:tail protein X n=1 Tax=uncultured Kiloniella sp. TaxID=1133091 RepID=UPI00261C87D3|nr:tail protein X [uncultured Kiloniella sp.]